jgi:hypothetical protein
MSLTRAAQIRFGLEGRNRHAAPAWRRSQDAIGNWDD